MDDGVSHVVLRESYTLRMGLSADHHPLALGVVHSHPEGCAPMPSWIDDDMDAYLSTYFVDFAPGRPYVSLIVSRHGTTISVSGRVWWRNAWHAVTAVHVERTPVECWIAGRRPATPPRGLARVARLSSAFGAEASDRLRRSCVAVIGAGGTGSAAIEALARAGVGRLIIVDPDHIEESNLERVHGSTPQDAAEARDKVRVASEHVRQIAPNCDVTALVGRLPQPEVVEALLAADVVLGCTDSHHSRLALSDLAVRFLLPSLDVGVALEGGDGRVTGQIIQFVRYLAADACAWCRATIDPVRLAQELASPAERARRLSAAAEAIARGEPGDPYWRHERQLDTVGYLTTTAGSLVAGYAIGWLTARFDPPFARLQMNVTAPGLETIDCDTNPRDDCVCRRMRGWAEQASSEAFVVAPAHWPPVEILS
ncbi:MAG: ThiF family adenylyltransferase [Gemmatimonadetes bacterium]|nr:ThiF family adenylyltransferase [Gemmatimonadota bacterium]